jgi:transcriptional regulator with XRE-family HTH domain
MNDRLKELKWRIPTVRPSPESRLYAKYVRTMRVRRGWTRAQLSLLTGLERGFLTLLENNMLWPEEVDQRVKRRIETKLGFSYASYVKIRSIRPPDRRKLRICLRL